MAGACRKIMRSGRPAMLRQAPMTPLPYFVILERSIRKPDYWLIDASLQHDKTFINGRFH